MANKCFFTGKGTAIGRTRSHSMRQGKRKFKVNLIKKKVSLWDGIVFRIPISSKIYKKMRGMI